MGYDSRLYIIRKGKEDHFAALNDKYKYAEKMVIYEMCVFPPFQSLFNESCPITEYAPYADDGETVITKDMYGEPLRERTLNEVIDCLERHIELNNDSYARIKPLLALLKEYSAVQNDWYDLAVLHYGH